MSQTSQLRRVFNTYPPQFWLMFVGMLISTTGSSMIWPFWIVYVKKTLNLPLSEVTLLPLINAAVAIITSLIAGPVVDRFGRKWAMVFSLATNGLAYVIMSQANSLLFFLLTSSLQGFANPIYRIGADAMMADLLPPEKRIGGYSLFRMASNLGISIGPVLGGFITASSYTMAFLIAASGLTIYALLILLRAHETIPQKDFHTNRRNERFGGYEIMLMDKVFVAFLASFTLVMIGATLIWQLLPVYTITYFQVPEQQFGFIFATNALMVVFLQILVTKLTQPHPARLKMAIGGFLYTSAVISVAFGQGFWGFWVCMVVMTFGELILIPTSSTFVANLAPEDMRGRYMGVYGLAQVAAHGIGPWMGGLLSDYLGPRFIWFGGGLVGMIGVVGFLWLARLAIRNKAVEANRV